MLLSELQGALFSFALNQVESKLGCIRMRMYILLYSIAIFTENTTVSHAELIGSDSHTGIRYTFTFTNINDLQSVLSRHFIAQVDSLDLEKLAVVVLIGNKRIT